MFSIAEQYAEDKETEYYEQYLAYDELTRQDPAEQAACRDIYQEAYIESLYKQIRG